MTSLHKLSSQPWLFDISTSHHVIGDVNNLQQFLGYGGPNELNISNNSGLRISQVSNKTITHKNISFSLKNILCAPSLQNNIIFVSIFCRTNHVSLEFFTFHFHVKDLRVMLHRENINDIYCLPHSVHTQVHPTAKSQFDKWHKCLGHPASPII